jgi:hypothetical protein
MLDSEGINEWSAFSAFTVPAPAKKPGVIIILINCLSRPNGFVLIGGGHTDLQTQHPASQNLGLIFNRPLVLIGLK